MVTYGNHWWNAMGSALNLGLRDDDRWLACLPFFHVGGLSIVMRSAIYGIPIVLQHATLGSSVAASTFDPLAVNRAMEEHDVTIVSVVSTMLSRMLAAMGDRVYPPALRCVLLGGGPAPLSLLQECARRGIPVTQTYGLTETASQLATLAPAQALRKLGSAGRPLLPNELRILPLRHGGTASTDHGIAQAPAAAEAGEILVRGPSVTGGYLPDDGNLEAPLPAADADGWLHTGDIGYLDGEGYLYVLDRRVDLIVSGGENIYPAEVEAVLHAHPAVAEAAVYGVADDTWGQRVAAAIVVRAGERIGEQEIVAFCRERLAAYKVPSRINLVDALPRNAAGKLLRRRLRGS
jgi:O-succinylbenzoic acid--CoA ligase